MSLNLVLCEPQIPQNTGNISRTCAVVGAALHLIKPLGFEITESRVRRAGLDYWDKLDIFYYDGLAEFLEQHGGKASGGGEASEGKESGGGEASEGKASGGGEASEGKASGGREKLFFFSTKAERFYSDVTYPDGAYLIFGREDAGLPEDVLLKYSERCVKLPMRGGLRSLNLSNTAAVAAYEYLRQRGFPGLM